MGLLLRAHLVAKNKKIYLRNKLYNQILIVTLPDLGIDCRSDTARPMSDSSSDDSDYEHRRQLVLQCAVLVTYAAGAAALIYGV